MQRPDRILVPVDFSEPARAAVARAFSLAGRVGADIELIHAHDPEALAYDFEAPPDLIDQVHAVDRASFARFCEPYEDGGREFTRSLIEGDPSRAIHRHARMREADLIVMGTQGRRGPDRLLLGSVAERTVRGAPAPVYVVRETVEEAMHPVRSILFATDFSEDAERAERWVADWARILGSEVEVFHAIQEPSVILAPYAVPGATDFDSEMLEAAQHRMERVIDRLAAAGVSAKAKTIYGRAPDSVVDRATATGAQLIVMGSRGYSRIRRFLLGSVTQYVLSHAPCSVLVTSPPDPRAIHPAADLHYAKPHYAEENIHG